MRSWGASVVLDDLQLQAGDRTVDVARTLVDPHRADAQPSSGELADWSEFDGHWEQTAQGSVQPEPAGPGTKLIWNGAEFADGSVSTAVKVKGGRDAGLLLRVSAARPGVDALTGYNINFSQHRLRLGKHQNNWRELTAVPCEFPADTFVPVRVEVEGPRIRVFVDDGEEPLIDFVDPQPLPPGMIGFRTYGCPVEFRELMISSPQFSGNLEFDELQLMGRDQWRAAGLRPDQSRRQALEAFCLLLLNLNEMIYVE